MIYMKKFFILFFISCSFAFFAAAEPYFATQTISPTLLETPYKEGSKDHKKELEEMILLQKNPPKNEIKKSREEHHFSWQLLTKEIEPLLTEKKYPAFYKLLNRIEETSKIVNENAKEYWNTRRPYLADSRIKALIKPHINPSYPSGHTCGAYSTAFVMALLLPQKKKHFISAPKKLPIIEFWLACIIRKILKVGSKWLC
jgi:hypothetical protein